MSHVAEVIELRSIVTDKGTESKVAVLPLPHRLRDTFLTAAHEWDLRELNITTLANRALTGGKVTGGYIRSEGEHPRVRRESGDLLLGDSGQQQASGEQAAQLPKATSAEAQ